MKRFLVSASRRIHRWAARRTEFCICVALLGFLFTVERYSLADEPERQAVPDPAAQEQSFRQIQEIFEDEYT